MEVEVVLNGQYHLPAFLDFFATFLFGFSGAIIAMEKGYDFIGVIFLAVITSMGGAIMRDLLLDAGIPAMLADYRYLLMVFLGAFTGVIFRLFEQHRKISFTIEMVDAIALGMYAVWGTQKSILYGVGILSACFIVLLNSVGGGIIRNIIIREQPKTFLPGNLYSTVSVVVIFTFLFLGAGLGIQAEIAATVAIVFGTALRFLALRYDWRTKPFLQELTKIQSEDKS